MTDPTPDRVVAVYLTFPDTATAETLASELVAAHLAACVNDSRPRRRCIGGRARSNANRK